MFRRNNNVQGLTLTIEDETLNFPTPREFEFAMAGRTNLPPSKVTALMSQPDAVLLREAEGIRSVEQRFADALSGMLEDVTSIGPFLKELDMALVSQDHGWRQIMMALNLTERTFEEFKKVALVKYMQYLTSRQDMIQVVYNTRRASRTMQMASPPLADGKGHNRNGQFRDTLIFNVSNVIEQLPSAPEIDSKLSRIPKGETVEFSVSQDDEVPVLLAQHPCSVLRKDKLMFVDSQGQDAELRPGKSIVGRDLSCDVVVDPSLREVSRKHLIVEVDGELVRLTDISSHGTSVPDEYLENTSI